MGLFSSKDDRAAARSAKQEPAQRQQAALDDFVARATQAADRGDIAEEERVLTWAWKWGGKRTTPGAACAMIC
jgi:predicted transcriptional regulator